MDRRMSWLSPKRRRTTGNLKTLANGHRRATSDEPPVTKSTQETPTSGLPSLARQLSHPSLSPPRDVVESIAGGSEAGNEEPGQPKEEWSMHSEITRLEEQFKRMLEAVEKNTESVNRLAQQDKDDAGTMSGRLYSLGEEDKSNEVPGHLWRMGDLLGRNMEHIEGLTKRQMENEHKLDYMLENTKPDTNSIDMAHLSTHLGRIQNLLERFIEERQEERKAREDVHSTELSQVSERLETLQQSVNQSSAAVEDHSRDGPSTSLSRTNSSPVLDGTLLLERLDSIHEVLQEHSTQMEAMVTAQNATKEAVENDIDFAPLAEHMDTIRESIDQIPEIISVNTEHLQELVEIHGSRGEAPPPAGYLELTPLRDHLSQIHNTLQDLNIKLGKQPSGIGDPKFLLDALSSHLRKIQNTTEQNSNDVKSLVANAKQQRNDTESMEKRLEATNGQVRELMIGQREMTSAMRELAQAITAQNKASCDHVVIPPPRKMGRKVVGFVYDAKEAAF